MKPQENKPSSFPFFYPIDDPQFIQYLENYCLNLQKRQKEIQQNAKNWTLFMEEDMAEANNNGFLINMSRPSFKCFDFKNYVGSIEKIPRCSFVKNQTQNFLKNELQCKIEQESQTQNKTNISQNQQVKNEMGFQRQKIKSEKIKQLEASKVRREKRLNQIMLGLDLIQKEILNLMENFEP